MSNRTCPTRDGEIPRADVPSGVLVVGSLALLGSCAVVALAHHLGAHWLAQPALGLPAGVWVVVLSAALGVRSQRKTTAARSAGEPRPAMPGRPQSGLARWSLIRRRVVTSAVEFAFRSAWAADSILSRTPVGGLGFDETSRMRISARLRGLRRRASPVRIGLAMRRRRAELVLGHVHERSTWVVMEAVTDGPRAAGEGADAVVLEECPGVVRIQTIERPGSDAAWFDWGRRRPMSYESVFPLRLDPFQVRLDLSSDGDIERSADITAALALAAAVHSRHEERLDVADHLLGRRIAPGCLAAAGGEDPVRWSMSNLASLMEWRSRSGRATAADRAAARVVSAWLASWDETVSEDRRRSWCEACARVLPDEPEVMLRLGAVRLSCMDDEMGIAALRDADAMLHGDVGLLASDPGAFLRSELEHGPENPMTVGRVASGLCLAFAGVPTDRLAFVQEDLLDDMRFASWLVGRDQDRALLVRVLRELREAREGREMFQGRGEAAPPARAA
ncbi:MAG: hypothetical protein JNK70_08705 [Phycisphaerae bacterium]|nr:hypothetical protein [Phycisphaerae bacterium]